MSSLPVLDILSELRSSLESHHRVILQAPPGAGKTTGIPPALLEEPWLVGQKILLLEPRRLAARNAAHRMASQLQEKVGDTIGYRMRMDTRISAHTRIEVITEGVLTRLLQADPALEGIGLIIFDEFHERSLDADLGLALSLQCQEIFREDTPLRLLIMSATLDGEPLQKLLGNAPLVTSRGRSFAVKVLYNSPWQPKEPIEPRVLGKITQVLAESSGNLLVFLPGAGEINRVARNLREHFRQDNTLIIAPLYGNLPLSEQQAAIATPPQGSRKVVLATSIAETSLTIDGITQVIDCGLTREPEYDPKTGMARLATVRISQAASEQRAGRAGRLAPGTCHRLWSQEQQFQLAPHSMPEILQADLCSLYLQLHRWGCDASELHWLNPPPASTLQQAHNLLQRLGALEHTGQLTPHGQTMAGLPVHPRLAHLLLIAHQQGCTALGCQLAALLSERDPGQIGSADITQRLHWLNHPAHSQPQLHKRIQAQARQLQSLLPPADTHSQLSQSEQLGLLVATAWPDRIACQKGAHGHYLLANGRAARLQASDPLNSETWLAVAWVGGHSQQSRDNIWLASPLDTSLFNGPLAHLIQDKAQIDWDSSKGRLIAEQQRRCGTLILESRPLPHPDPDTVTCLLLQQIRQQGLALLQINPSAVSLQQRMQLLHQGAPDNWPNFTTEHLLATLESWLAPYLVNITKLTDFKQLDLHQILLSQLDWQQQQMLDQQAPERFQVPSGSRIAIDYSQSPPVLAVKLQEMFGCRETPRIGKNTELVVHLLSPAGRPLQITQDLAHFWQHSYPEVKKEMKGRYPKHPWPDDPLTAAASAKTQKQLARAKTAP